MSVAVITPNDDRHAALAGKWGRDVATFFHTRTLQVRNREAANAELSANEHVIYFGHGIASALVSRRYAFSIFRQREIADVANLPRPGRVVIAVACWSASVLGRSLRTGAQPGVDTYVGWLDEVCWPAERPEPIGAAYIESLALLADGQPVRHFIQAFQQAMKDAHDLYADQLRWNPYAKMQALYLKERIYAEGDLDRTIV
jgi:hypothetical protein